jgi:type IV pilus assembly protein PilY1
VLLLVLAAAGLYQTQPARAAKAEDYQATPPFVTAGAPPLVMLVMGKNHKLFYEAYNDASDLNGDGELDVGYNPDIEYYGYFDSRKCYLYDSGQYRFEPAGPVDDANKTCSGANEWSGDYLNYLTMSRMDCLRKVLYGGYRDVDSPSETVLQRAYIPQDAHSWGKEYLGDESYSISDYTPLAEPEPGTHHFFASTTLSENGAPLLRVLSHNMNVSKIWNWVAKERPVCDSTIDTSDGGTDGINHSGDWQIVREHFVENLRRVRYETSGYEDNSTDGVTDSNENDGWPDDHQEYKYLVDNYATGSPIDDDEPTDLDMPDQSNDETFLTVVNGTINIRSSGTYTFKIDGDDAVEFAIDKNRDGDFEDTDELVVGYYGDHSLGSDSRTGDITFGANETGEYPIRLLHQEYQGQEGYKLWLNTPEDCQLEDKTVRVQVAQDASNNCKLYSNATNQVYKPIGILQRHGESDRMYFGLLTGSYTNNMSGGVLRKNIRSIKDEINEDTGEFLYQDVSSVDGIIETIDKLRILDFDYGHMAYDGGWSNAWVTDRPMNEGEFPDWGNPTGEMMYETLRYFAGKSSPTSEFDYSGDDRGLDLPKENWVDPYNATSGHDYCSKPFMLVLSDIYPTYDSDQLPGSAFSSFTGDLTGLDVESLANTIGSEEGLSSDYYIGQNCGSSSCYNGACTPKSVGGDLGDIRGLCPEEPTKQGSYYSSAVAYYGHENDLSGATKNQTVNTYSVGLASPLPKIRIPVGNKTVTLVPFAKSVGGCLDIYEYPNDDFYPTNTIVDFFVSEIGPDYGKFRINFEDVEQGADHDMDAIVVYEYEVTSNDKVKITLSSRYAAGCVIQHMGYIISGTQNDGTYLEVRDVPDSGEADVDHPLDTPPGVWASDPESDHLDGSGLPLETSRTFTPGATSGATLLKNPLYYAAKWGGFRDSDGSGKPDAKSEWDKDGDDSPDTYFYVQNPLKLEEQLNRSFADILRRTSSGTAASVISQSRSGEGAVYQAIFYPEFKDSLGHTTKWAGDVHSLFVDGYGNMREDTNQNDKLDLSTDKVLVFEGNTVYKYGDDDGNGRLNSTESSSPDATGDIKGLKTLWSVTDWLNDELTSSEAVTQRSTFDALTDNRYIFTFADADNDMIVDSGEQQAFQLSSPPSYSGLTDTSNFYSYLTMHPTASDIPSAISTLKSTNATLYRQFLCDQAQMQVDFIRGEDQPSYTVNTGGSAYTFSYRNRTVDFDGDGDLETWRLGDVAYSTPTLVGQPAENYHLLYRDGSYLEFLQQYKNRRNVVYAGGNDGMFHAFNAGFYNSTNHEFVESRDGKTAFELGQELWAYVPYNLLPHLYWLMDKDYSHVYYSDMKPKIFDAKIFPADSDHPNGWGTVLVGGMRFGGGAIGADTNRDGAADRTMTSAFFVLDITNPEEPPEVLAELSFDGLGYTTCYPAVALMKDKDASGAINENDWYLILGSGPADATGDPGTGASLSDASSSQKGRVFMVDLNQLASGTLTTIDPGGGVQNGATNAEPFQKLRDGTFVSDPVTVDYDMNYSTDVVYFGTVGGGETNASGSLRRLVLNNRVNTADWDLSVNGQDPTNSTLIDLDGVYNGQPVTAAPAVAKDEEGNRWVYFGTGRFYTRQDAENSDMQSYYGVKEPTDSGGDFAWTEVTRSGGANPYDQGLVDVTYAEVYNATGVQNVSPAAEWEPLVSHMEQNASGWYMDFTETNERNLGQGALIGDILTFTSYVPSTDVCSFAGESNLYALHYKTGTAYFEEVIGIEKSTGLRLKKMDLGSGMTVTPNIHTGREKGSKAFVQTSTGGIEVIQQQNPGMLKSGKVFWKKE